MATTGNFSSMREKMGDRPPYQGSGGGGGTTPPPMYFGTRLYQAATTKMGVIIHVVTGEPKDQARK